MRTTLESNLEQTLPPQDTTGTQQPSMPGVLAAANSGAPSSLVSSLRFPGDDGGRSLAQMAQRDLDAALQLLADRAQYITGANGAAIALRRSGRSDMLCRASTGSNVPEVGALLSTEFGLSGESVRTRKLLRCDDAERDPRVNREGCRQLGIASVVVIPVVHDDEVLGVFELFSGRVNAFGDRDLSALQRLSEMVETAVQLARAAESIPPLPTTADAPVTHAEVAEDPEEEILEVEAPSVAEALETTLPIVVQAEVSLAKPDVVGRQETAEPLPIAPTAPALPSTEKKPLFWSASVSPVSDVEKAEPTDQSHVPPMLRNLRSCEVCGFPVSPGRALCVECDEKKWRGQLRRSAKAQSVVPQPSSVSVSQTTPHQAQLRAGCVSAAAPSAATEAPARGAADSVESIRPVLPTALARQSNETVKRAAPALSPVRQESARAESREPQSPDFVLSAGLEPSQSWLAANKYVVAILLLLATGAAAFAFLR